MSAAQVQIRKIVLREGNRRCHYCKDMCSNKGSKRATREHVVPKAYGGPNHVDNYVLACSDCNSKRGTAMFYCKCDFCSSIIEKFLSDSGNVEDLFTRLVTGIKPVIRKATRSRRRPWLVIENHHLHTSFATFEEAIAYVTSDVPCGDYR